MDNSSEKIPTGKEERYREDGILRRRSLDARYNTHTRRFCVLIRDLNRLDGFNEKLSYIAFKHREGTKPERAYTALWSHMCSPTQITTGDLGFEVVTDNISKRIYVCLQFTNTKNGCKRDLEDNSSATTFLY